MLQRIPLVRTVYSAAKSFAEVVLTDSTESFKKVMLIEYPRKGLYSLCFPDFDQIWARFRSRTGEAGCLRVRADDAQSDFRCHDHGAAKLT